jgi:hypothetical protein
MRSPTTSAERHRRLKPSRSGWGDVLRHLPWLGGLPAPPEPQQPPGTAVIVLCTFAAFLLVLFALAQARKKPSSSS